MVCCYRQHRSKTVISSRCSTAESSEKSSDRFPLFPSSVLIAHLLWNALFLLPASPFGLNTNTFDIHGRQSNIGATFIGPEANGFTPSATFVSFIANDTLTGDSYGFLPYNAFGESQITNGDSLLACRMMFSIHENLHRFRLQLCSRLETLGSFRSPSQDRTIHQAIRR